MYTCARYFSKDSTGTCIPELGIFLRASVSPGTSGPPSGRDPDTGTTLGTADGTPSAKPSCSHLYPQCHQEPAIKVKFTG